MDSSSAESSIGGSLNLRRSYLSTSSASAPGELPLPVCVTQLEYRSPDWSDPVFNLGNLRTTDAIIFKNLKLLTNMSKHTDMSSQLLEVTDFVSSDAYAAAAAADLVPPEERAFSIPSGDLVPSDDVADLVPSKVGASFAEVSDFVSSDAYAAAAAADLVPPEERAFFIPSGDIIPSNDVDDLVHSEVGASFAGVSDFVSSDAYTAAADLIPPEERAFSFPSGDLIPSDDVADLVHSEEVADLVPSDDLADLENVSCELEEDIKSRLIILAGEVMGNWISIQDK